MGQEEGLQACEGCGLAGPWGLHGPACTGSGRWAGSPSLWSLLFPCPALALSLGPPTARWPPRLIFGAEMSANDQGPEDSVAGCSPGTLASFRVGEQRGPNLGGWVATAHSPSCQGWVWREEPSGALCRPGGSGRKEVAAAALDQQSLLLP